MNTRPVLFVSNGDKNCGVYQFGRNVASALARAQAHSYIYVECGNAVELTVAVQEHKPKLIVYNFHPATMRWLGVLQTRRIAVPQLGLIHEVTQSVADRADNALFDYHIAADPTLLLRNPRVFKTGRFVPVYLNNAPMPEVPTIGSFGFATPGKGFVRLVTQVQNEFDQAIIRLHIPFATFGDHKGERAREMARLCAAAIDRPGIRLEVTHDFLSDDGLLQFLAGNSLNAFLYDEGQGRGISSVVDYALGVGRPLAISSSSMFRHIRDASPSVVVDHSSLQTILDNGIAPLAPFRAEWTPENLAWDYDRIVSAVLIEESRPRAHHWFSQTATGRVAASSSVLAARTGFAFGKRILEHVEKYIPSDAAKKVATRTDVVARKVVRRLSALNSSAAHLGDWMPDEGNIVTIAQPNHTPRYIPPEMPRSFNRLLDDAARTEYVEAIHHLGKAAPEVFSRKLARANVQQAFVLDAVALFARAMDRPRMLCVGSFEDTASMALIAGGEDVFELDPVLNYDIGTFTTKPDVGVGAYDIAFSTSVIEHVVDDEAFAAGMALMLKPGGIAVLTCDFREGYVVGAPKPRADRRLYTQRDLIERILPAMKGCELVDEPVWHEGQTDFEYDGCRYAFASLVVRKG